MWMVLSCYHFDMTTPYPYVRSCTIINKTLLWRIAHIHHKILSFLVLNKIVLYLKTYMGSIQIVQIRWIKRITQVVSGPHSKLLTNKYYVGHDRLEIATCFTRLTMASHDFLPTLTEYDIQRAAEVSRPMTQPSRTSAYRVMHGAASSTGVLTINVNQCWTVEGPSTRSLRDSEAPWSLGTGDSVVKPPGSECSVLRGPHCTSEDSKGLVGLFFLHLVTI